MHNYTLQHSCKLLLYLAQYNLAAVPEAELIAGAGGEYLRGSGAGEQWQEGGTDGARQGAEQGAEALHQVLMLVPGEKFALFEWIMWTVKFDLKM